MILQSLTEYYERKASGNAATIAPFGFERKEIPFLIVLDRAGRFVELVDTRTAEGKRRVGGVFAVPQAVKRTVAVLPNLLWDNSGYLLGRDNKGNPDRTQQQHGEFINAIRTMFSDPAQDAGINAILKFLESGNFQEIFEHHLWPEIAAGANLSFRLDGDLGLVCQRPAVVAAIRAKSRNEETAQQACLITGEVDSPARLHPPIKGVWDTQSAGGNIVSFNLDAFNSFGKKQGANAPVGERAAFSYTTALNHLLHRDSRQRLQIGDASTVFWSAEETRLEASLVDILSEPPKDDPDRNTEAVRSLYRSPGTGAALIDEQDNTRFYVLGLAPNAARISIRFWYDGTVGELAGHIRQHFDDLRIVHAPHEPETLSVFRLLISTAMLGKVENIRPNLAGDFMRAVLHGTPYPRELLAAAVQRIRSEREITYPRVALIKALLARKARHNPDPLDREVTVSLDESNLNAAYRLGRLFAVLERAQEAANPGINATIRDRYYGAASTTPITVFPRLLKLKNHHTAKLENRGQAINLEKLIGGIMEGVADFPQLLSLADQGRFSIGYYHQRQAFFTPKDTEKGA